jgi:hypothetical protein
MGKWDLFKEKGEKVLGEVQQSPAVQDAVNVARGNPKEALCIILMVLGIIFSFHWLGSLVVGLGAALYIPWNIKELYHKAAAFYRLEGKLASLILLLTLVYLLLHTFGFVIGLLIGFSVKLLFVKSNKEKEQISNQSHDK